MDQLSVAGEVAFTRRQASLQNFTVSQSRAHFFRQSNGRPHTAQRFAGVDRTGGKVLSEQPVEAFLGMNILTPFVHLDMLFSSTYGGKTIGFKVAQARGTFTVQSRRSGSNRRWATIRTAT